MNSKPHAALLLSASQVASRERLFLAAATALSLRGWRVSILAPRPIAALAERVTPPLDLIDVAVLGSDAAPGWFPHAVRVYASLPAVERFLEDQRPDVLLSTSIPPNVVALLARRRANSSTPIIVRQSNVVPIGGHPTYGKVAHRPRDLMLPRLYPEAAGVLAVSEGVADNLRATGWVEDKKIFAIPNAVDIESVTLNASCNAPHPWLVKKQGRVIVAVGRLIAKKDYPTLFTAISQLSTRHDARLIVLGEGRMRGALQHLRKRLGLRDRIDLPGHRLNPFAYVQKADAFVLSSRFEGMPSALLEAMACGTPVVSTDCPSGPAELLDGGRYGELVPIGDAQALAQAIERSLDNPPEADVLRERASQFGLQPIARRYADLIEQTAQVCA